MNSDNNIFYDLFTIDLSVHACMYTYTQARSTQSIESIIDGNQYQPISINRLIVIIDDQLMVKIRVVIDWYQYQSIDKLVSIGCKLKEKEFAVFM